MDFRILQIDSLHWLWVVIGLTVVVIIGLRRKQNALRKFADSVLLQRLVPQISWPRQITRVILVLLAMIALVAALLDPRWGVTFQTVRQQGVDVMIVLDISRSMLAEDVRPNRLERSKQYINDLVEQLGGDRVGLVTFAGTATLKTPLTVDYGAYRLMLDMVNTEDAPRGGSLLGDALRLAADSFTDDAPDHKAIVVFSDGEDHGSYPLQAAATIKNELDIPIYTVGIGDSETGARIPIDAGEQTVFLTHENQQVWSKMDPEVMRQIAIETGGAFIPIGTRIADMSEIYRERIEPRAKREYETTTAKRHTVRYQWFAGLALLLLLIEAMMPDTKRVAANVTNWRSAA